MKEFNLDEAKAGKQVCTRDGRKARIICWDAKVVQNGHYPIMALVESEWGSEKELVFNYTLEGLLHKETEKCDLDLMIIGEKKEGWVNIYRSAYGIYPGKNIYDTKEQAIEEGTAGIGYVSTSKIEWEE